MSRLTRSLLLFSLPILMAAAPPLAGPDGDLGRLQGEWTVKAGPKRDIAVVLSIQGDEAIVDLTTPLGIKVHAEGKVKINDRAQPKTIDWVGFTIIDGEDFPEVLGIYELAGDSFRIVNGGPNDARPTEFKKGDGVLADVFVFQKARGNLARTGADGSTK